MAMHPFPQIRHVVQDVSAIGFGEKTVVRGNNNSVIEKGEVKDPVAEEKGEERGAGNLFGISKRMNVLMCFF